VENCLISDYEEIIPTLKLPDPDDRHVLAAAIVGQADLIITLNLDDFPPEELEPFGIEAQHPDTFVAHLIGLDQEAVCAAIRRMRERYKNEPFQRFRNAERSPAFPCPRRGSDIGAGNCSIKMDY